MKRANNVYNVLFVTQDNEAHGVLTKRTMGAASPAAAAQQVAAVERLSAKHRIIVEHGDQSMRYELSECA